MLAFGNASAEFSGLPFHDSGFDDELLNLLTIDPHGHRTWLGTSRLTAIEYELQEIFAVRRKLMQFVDGTRQ